MKSSNLKTQKKKEYNPFETRTVKRFTVGKVKGYLKAVKPNSKDVFGSKKACGMYYNNKGHVCTASSTMSEMYDSEKVYFYEVGANDGSYRKCRSLMEAERRFAQLHEFEKRQTEIR